MFKLGNMPLIQDYSLCNQVVTVYHRDKEHGISREILEGVYFDFEESTEVDERGSSEHNTFLLVVPGCKAPCVAGDKILLGIGEDVPADEMQWWRELIPTKRDDLVIARKVSPKFWSGEIVHYEIRG